jgi:hypothetical protein
MAGCGKEAKQCLALWIGHHTATLTKASILAYASAYYTELTLSLPTSQPSTGTKQSNIIILDTSTAMAKPKVPPPHGRRPPRPGGRLAGMKKKKHPSIKNQIRSLQRRLQKQGGGGEGGGGGDGGTQVCMCVMGCGRGVCVGCKAVLGGQRMRIKAVVQLRTTAFS